jgi:hypothetical protein
MPLPRGHISPRFTLLNMESVVSQRRKRTVFRFRFSGLFGHYCFLIVYGLCFWVVFFFGMVLDSILEGVILELAI